MKTIESWMEGAAESDWHPQSIWMAQHTRAGSFERRFAILMNENFRMTSDFETFVNFPLRHPIKQWSNFDQLPIHYTVDAIRGDELRLSVMAKEMARKGQGIRAC